MNEKPKNFQNLKRKHSLKTFWKTNKVINLKVIRMDLMSLTTQQFLKNNNLNLKDLQNQRILILLIKFQLRNIVKILLSSNLIKNLSSKIHKNFCLINSYPLPIMQQLTEHRSKACSSNNKISIFSNSTM